MCKGYTQPTTKQLESDQAPCPEQITFMLAGGECAKDPDADLTVDKFKALDVKVCADLFGKVGLDPQLYALWLRRGFMPADPSGCSAQLYLSQYEKVCPKPLVCGGQLNADGDRTTDGTVDDTPEWVQKCEALSQTDGESMHTTRFLGCKVAKGRGDKIAECTFVCNQGFSFVDTSGKPNIKEKATITCEAGKDTLEGALPKCDAQDECSSGMSQCSPDAECINRPNGYSCNCRPGFVGSGRINEKKPEESGCKESHHLDTLGSEAGGLVDAWDKPSVGKEQNECRPDIADQCNIGQGEKCHDLGDGYKCVAPSYVCTFAVSEQHGDGKPKGDCHCNPGYVGQDKNCANVDECKKNVDNCELGERCKDVAGSFICLNKDGEIAFDEKKLLAEASAGDVNECEKQEDKCRKSVVDEMIGGHQHGKEKCVNVEGGYACIARSYECVYQPGKEPNCHCNEGFTGQDTHCKDVNECNAETDNCEGGQVCMNVEGSFVCRAPEAVIERRETFLEGRAPGGGCLSGFSPKEALNGKGAYEYTCVDVNECGGGSAAAKNKGASAGVLCSVGKCVNLPGGFMCRGSVAQMRMIIMVTLPALEPDNMESKHVSAAFAQDVARAMGLNKDSVTVISLALVKDLDAGTEHDATETVAAYVTFSVDVPATSTPEEALATLNKQCKNSDSLLRRGAVSRRVNPELAVEENGGACVRLVTSTFDKTELSNVAEGLMNLLYFGACLLLFFFFCSVYQRQQANSFRGKYATVSQRNRDIEMNSRTDDVHHAD